MRIAFVVLLLSSGLLIGGPDEEKLKLVEPAAVFELPADITYKPKPTDPTPAPPTPGPTVLRPGISYPITCTVNFFCLSSPAGLVKLEDVATVDENRTHGWTSIFYGGSGAEEDKQYKVDKGRKLYVKKLTPIGVGNVEVFFVPVGVADQKNVQTRRVAVDSGKGPQPPPGPNPPAPGPNPDPVTPDDADTARLRTLLGAAYLKDADPDKVSKTQRLGQMYLTQSASITKTAANIPTWDAMLNMMVNERKKVMDDQSITLIRRELADYFNSKWPRDPSAILDDKGRELVAAEFARAAKVLGGLK